MCAPLTCQRHALDQFYQYHLPSHSLTILVDLARGLNCILW